MNFTLLNNRTTQSTSGGGYTSFRWAPKDFFAIIPLPDADNSGLISNDFVFKPGKDWIYFQTEDKEFELKEEASADSDGYTSTLNGFVKGENKHLRQFINDAVNSVDGYALLDNCNEISSMCFGKGKCCAATLKFNFESGKKTTDKKGFTLTLSIEQDGVNCMYEGVGSMTQSFSVAVDDATPDVSKGTATYLLPENTGATAITGLDNAIAGSLITLQWNSTTNHSTIASGATFQLASAFTPATGAILVLQATTASTFAERYRKVTV